MTGLHGMAYPLFEVAPRQTERYRIFTSCSPVILSPSIRQPMALSPPPTCLDPRFSPQEHLRLGLVGSNGP